MALSRVLCNGVLFAGFGMMVMPMVGKVGFDYLRESDLDYWRSNHAKEYGCEYVEANYVCKNQAGFDAGAAQHLVDYNASAGTVIELMCVYGIVVGFLFGVVWAALDVCRLNRQRQQPLLPRRANDRNGLFAVAAEVPAADPVVIEVLDQLEEAGYAVRPAAQG
jgi:hypothetical protein